MFSWLDVYFNAFSATGKKSQNTRQNTAVWFKKQTLKSDLARFHSGREAHGSASHLSLQQGRQ